MRQDRSKLAARTLDTADETVARVATDGRSVSDIAAEILARAGWLDARHTPPGGPARPR